MSRPKPYRNRTRVLVMASRGVDTRSRHFMGDLRRLIPHHKADAKFNLRDGLAGLQDVAEEAKCNAVVFVEGRRHQEAYLWVALTPAGPSARFHIKNLHTMMELKLTGNCLLGSRPILSFDAAFRDAPQWLLIHELLVTVFDTPRGHAKAKPFFDHVLSFSIQDEKIWVRHFQILDDASVRAGGRSLVEIGPRFVLDPHRILEGAFEGRTLWLNKHFVSPTFSSSIRKEALARRSKDRLKKRSWKERHQDDYLPESNTTFDGLF